MKKINHEDDSKYKKSVNICRRKVKDWKELLGYPEKMEVAPPVKKKVKIDEATLQRK